MTVILENLVRSLADINLCDSSRYPIIAFIAFFFGMLELCSLLYSPFPSHLVSQSPRMSHLYLSNSLTAKTSAPVYDKVQTFHVPIPIFSSLSFLILWQ